MRTDADWNEKVGNFKTTNWALITNWTNDKGHQLHYIVYGLSDKDIHRIFFSETHFSFPIKLNFDQKYPSFHAAQEVQHQQRGAQSV